MNQLLVNPKLPDHEKKTFEQLQAYFESEFGPTGFYFVPSSGSSKRSGESIKLIALTQAAVVNSADRFNRYFQATKADNWGLVLPTFHVAGLSVLARANLVGSRVLAADWNPLEMQNWFAENKISFLSLVPTQVYDLVQFQVQASKSLKKVFVGGGSLDSTLAEKFQKLGWPLVETYGMTETCSMIAIKEQPGPFKVMPEVEVYLENGLLRIHCNSVAHSSIQMKNGQIQITEFESGWIRTEDQVYLEEKGNELYLHFLGRAFDYVKILGEGVSLLELRQKLDQVALDLNILPTQRFLLTVPDIRAENAIVLAVDKNVDQQVADQLVQKFNQVVRGYEKIHKVIRVDQIPVSELGKIRLNELKDIVLKNIEVEVK